ncbi:MAG: eukaryotic-like serine/threonine-protein kinase [Actinomycetota bacterium]|nr:eukaryotic-like serine/threonine-protein kinase [Actinomycetota bacterium]
MAGAATSAGWALGQTAPAGWTQYQGGAAHPGSVADGPAAPFAVDHVTTFSDLPGGSSETLGLSAPIVSGETAVVVGPLTVQAVSLGDGGMEWSAPRVFGPSVPAAIYDPSTDVQSGGATCKPCDPVVVYTEGWGTGPGGATSSSSPTTSVRPGPSGEASSSEVSPTPRPSGAQGSSSPSATDPSATAVPSDVMARNLADGSRAWDTQLQLKATSRTGVTIDASTAFVGDIRGNVYAIDASTGKVRWTRNVGGFLDSPLAAADGQVLVSVDAYSAESAKLVALDESTGKVDWVYDTTHPGYLTSPSIAEGRAFIGVTSGGTVGLVSSLVSVDLTNGTVEWESLLSAPVTFATAPPISGDRVFIEDTSGDVFAFDRASGDRAWLFATNKSFVHGAPLVVGEQILIPNSGATLIVLDAASGHQVFTSADVGGPLRYPAPVGTDRVIFIRGGSEPGIVTFITDPNGAALTDVPSPTTADYGKILSNFAVAALGLTLLSLLVFRPVARRMGPAFFVEGDEAAELTAGEDL